MFVIPLVNRIDLYCNLVSGLLFGTLVHKCLNGLSHIQGIIQQLIDDFLSLIEPLSSCYQTKLTRQNIWPMLTPHYFNLNFMSLRLDGRPFRPVGFKVTLCETLGINLIIYVHVSLITVPTIHAFFWW